MAKFKSKIKALVDKHNEEVKAIKADAQSKIKAWKDDKVYSDAYKKERIQEIEKEMKTQCAAIDEKYNKQIQEIVVSEKSSIIGKPSTKPADYQLQISNALKFIELAGKNLTDDQAYGILKPFQGDYETMSLFQSAVYGLAGNLENRFEKTFKKTNDFLIMMNNFELAEKTAGKVLNSIDSISNGVGLNLFMDSIDTIENFSESFEA